MKKWSKIAWIFVAVLAILGVCCLGTGWIVGIDGEKLREEISFGPFALDMGSIHMNRAKETEVEEETEEDFEDSLDEALDQAVSETSKTTVTEQADAFTSDMQVHSYDKIKEIEADVKYGTLKVQLYDGNQVVVHAQKINEKDFSLQASGSKLKVKDESIQKAPGESSVIIIEIPKNQVFDAVDLQVDAGTMEVGKLTADAFEAEVAAGTMKLTGQITSEEASLSVGAGTIRAELLDAPEISLDCDAGTINAKLAGAQEDYYFDGSCGAGKIDFGSDRYTMFDHEIGHESDHDSSHATQERKVEADCGIGNIQISFTA